MRILYLTGGEYEDKWDKWEVALACSDSIEKLESFRDEHFANALAEYTRQMALEPYRAELNAILESLPRFAEKPPNQKLPKPAKDLVTKEEHAERSRQKNLLQRQKDEYWNRYEDYEKLKQQQADAIFAERHPDIEINSVRYWSETDKPELDCYYISEDLFVL